MSAKQAILSTNFWIVRSVYGTRVRQYDKSVQWRSSEAPLSLWHNFSTKASSCLSFPIKFINILKNTKALLPKGKWKPTGGLNSRRGRVEAYSFLIKPNWFISCWYFTLFEIMKFFIKKKWNVWNRKIPACLVILSGLYFNCTEIFNFYPTVTFNAFSTTITLNIPISLFHFKLLLTNGHTFVNSNPK